MDKNLDSTTKEAHPCFATFQKFDFYQGPLGPCFPYMHNEYLFNKYLLRNSYVKYTYQVWEREVNQGREKKWEEIIVQRWELMR